jgi:hypothetical protein
MEIYEIFTVLGEYEDRHKSNHPFNGPNEESGYSYFLSNKQK